MTYKDLNVLELIQHAIDRKEGCLAANQALSVETGLRTGRSPQDRFIVQTDSHASSIDWGAVNRPISPDIFQSLWDKAQAYLGTCDTFTDHLIVGADLNYALNITVQTDTAWQNLFAKQMFIRPESDEQKHFLAHAPVDRCWKLISASRLELSPELDRVRSEAALIISFEERKILLCGLRYAGEIKKSAFSVMNYLMPEQDVLPMHCAANQGENGDVVLFFGLSGTGKTTLSADPKRHLIGDDEHGWSPIGVFNFEGGCYAKCINLSQNNEPTIYNAIRYGSIMENVVLDAQGWPDYTDSTLTQNTRAAYPRDLIDGCVPSNQGKHPQSVIFLTCDLYGVLPAVSILSTEQAMYYFLSGYTALVGSTEMDQGDGIKTTFSSCFGAPFFPRHPTVYADLLKKKLLATGAQVYLVNTGWSGGSYGKGGSRFSIPYTRSVIDHIIDGSVLAAPKKRVEPWNLEIPIHCGHLADTDPSQKWPDIASYVAASYELIRRFDDNFKKFDISFSSAIFLSKEQ